MKKFLNLLFLIFVFLTPLDSAPQKSKQKAKPKPKAIIVPPFNVMEKISQNGKLYNFETDESKLEFLAQAFKNKENFRVLFMGDSHIAGDFISNQWRVLFENQDEIGYSYPIYPQYHQNISIKVKHSGFELYNSRKSSYTNFPFGGVVARAKTEKAVVNISAQLLSKTRFFNTQILFKSPNKLGAFLVTDSRGVTHRLGANKPNTWELSPKMNLAFPITINALMPNASLGGYIIKKNNGNSISHAGINGVRSDLFLRWDSKTNKEVLSNLDSSLIVFCYGSNDSVVSPFNEERYIRVFSDLIKLARSSNKNANILIIGPPQMFSRDKNGRYFKTPNFDKVRKATKEVAKLNKTLYFDMFEFIEDNGGKSQWVKLGLSKQDVHLTPYGYKLVANSTFKELDKLLSKYEKKAKTGNKLESKKKETNEPNKTNKSHQNIIIDDKTRQLIDALDDYEFDFSGFDNTNVEENKGIKNIDSTNENLTSLPLPPSDSAPSEIEIKNILDDEKWEEIQIKEKN